jgi:aminodeoxyfutalosine synthase
MLNTSLTIDSVGQNLKSIVTKIINENRISEEEGLLLYTKASLPLLGSLANTIRQKKNGNQTFFNKNIHIEPTNICVFDCKFCSYSRKLSKKVEAWELTIDEMVENLKAYEGKGITEVHLVGGVHPKMGLYYFIELIQKIKEIRPDIHIKAFTAVELEYMCKKAKVSYKEGLQMLKDAGQDSLPGGGAEIFDKNIRNEICADKCNSETWLEIHETAHKLGMPSNATILYGHIEKPIHIIDHLSRLRELQDKTGGFNTFIPLKYRNGNNQMSHINEGNIVNDMRLYAFARIFLDNFNHLKAYWPMIGKKTTQNLLAFGVDDIDGTIDDTTKIYSMAGVEDQNPAMTTEDIVKLIKDVGRDPVQRDTLYNTITEY